MTEEVGKEFSVQLPRQLLTRSQLSIERLNIIFYKADWMARSVANDIKCTECKKSMFADQPFDASIGRLMLLKQSEVDYSVHHAMHIVLPI